VAEKRSAHVIPFGSSPTSVQGYFDCGRELRARVPDIDAAEVGAGYGTLTENVRAALVTTARDEGIYLDPTHTGRAMAALLSGSIAHGDRVVFLHSGGLPGLFGHPQI
jgi:1-aminocyclopropane-1-carboxylate deaminase/D-cysteine desulfhydrase-like pyridoxal-dependent ACC family enzyme